MIEDAELLRCYIRDRSEAAFKALVQRHANLVYSVALRQVGGDAHLAQDVTQKVFADLARKASALAGRASLGGWLYRGAQFAASDIVRAERRRRAREQEAHTMHETTVANAPHGDWEKLRPVLDETLAELGERDRDAIILRFLEGRPFAEVGARLQLTENAARMRVDRALQKLHGRLARRGLTSTMAALAVAVGGQAAVAAPVGLVASASEAALAGGVATGGWASGIFQFMGMTKLNSAFAGTLALAAISAVSVQQAQNARLQREVTRLESDTGNFAALRAENERLAKLAAEIQSWRSDDRALAELQRDALTLRNQAGAAAVRPVVSGPAWAATALSTIYDLASLDQPPSPRFQSKPVYPVSLRKAGVTGRALISFVVRDDGQVGELTVVSSTHPEFGPAALEAVDKWKFSPGRKNGQVVNARMQVPIVFSIAAPEAAPKVNWF